MHVGGASHGGRLFRENVRGHLRFFVKHHGRPGEAERARTLLRASLRAARPARTAASAARMYREAAAWLGSGDVGTLLAAMSCASFLLAPARDRAGLVLAPGAIVARALGVRGTSATLAWGARRSSSRRWR